MDDEIGVSEFVDHDSTSQNEVLDSGGLDQLPLLETSDVDSPSLAVVEVVRAYDAHPQNYIRLLRILPGNLGNEVCCELRQCTLNEQTQSSALSHTWGAKPAEHA